MQHAETPRSLVASLGLSMPDDAAEPTDRGPVDSALLDRIATHLEQSLHR